MKRLLLVPALFLALAALQPASAQTGVIEGEVIESESGEPLPGVNVVIREEQLGATTDDQGMYAITDVPEGTLVLEARFVGFQTETREVEVPAGETVIVDFGLAPERVGLEEVVVTGTGGETSQRELGTSISTLDASEAQELTGANNFSELLEGQMTNVRSTSPSGSVGSGKDLRIRGTSSFTLGQRPAIYIDGIRVDTRQSEWSGGGARFDQEFSGGQGTDRMSDLNPEEIESIEVVKGAAAATLYGSDAANGVIQLITNKGELNSAPSWNLRLSTGVNRHRENFPTTMYPNFEGSNGFQARDANSLIENGYTRSANISVGGGGNDFSYFVSTGYSYAQGSLQPNRKRRGNVRGNLRWLATENLTFEFTSAFTISELLEQQAGNNWNALYGNAILGNPRVATEDRPFGEPWTSVQNIRQIDAFSNLNRYSVGITTRYEQSVGVEHRLTVGLDNVNNTRERFLPFGTEFTYVPGDAERNLHERNFKSWTVDYLGSVNFDLTSAIGSELSWGAQGFREDEQLGFAVGRGFAGPGVRVVGGGSRTNGDEEISERVSIGIYAQNRFSFWDRLFVNGGIRIDGNSAFGTNYGLQPYPKGDISYLISEESFIPDVFTSLKLRAALGMAGLSPGAFDEFRTFNPISVLGDKTGVTPAAPGNPNLEPEKSLEFETGIEAALWEDRLFFDFTYYQQRTRDALIPVELPPSEGFPEPQLRNIGEVENRGFELAVDAIPVQTENLSWNTKLNLSKTMNEVVDIGDRERFAVGNGFAVEGYPVGGIWAFEPVDYDPEANTFTSSEERIYQGPSLPDVSFSFSNGLTVGSFRVNVAFTGEFGAVFSNGSRDFQANFGTGDEYLSLLDENQEPTQESKKLQQRSIQFDMIDSRNHIKLQRITASYKLPNLITSRLNVDNASVSITGSNLYWWDNCNCAHPQTNYLGGSSFSTANNFLGTPPQRSIKFSFRASF